MKHQSIAFKKAENYFKTTKEFINEEKKRLSPFGWIGSLFSSLFPHPIEEIT